MKYRPITESLPIRMANPLCPACWYADWKLWQHHRIELSVRCVPEEVNDMWALRTSAASVKLDFVEIGNTEDSFAIDRIELQFGEQSLAPMKDDAERNAFRRYATSLGEDDRATARRWGAISDGKADCGAPAAAS